jgi:hypothetical protein
MGDAEKVASEVNAKSGREEISDACARVIASWWHGGQKSLGYSFVSTGAITDASDLWRELFPDYSSLSDADKIAADMLGTYFTNAGTRGPIEGWSGLWL